MKVLIAVKEANKKESKIIMAKETKKIDTVKKLEKDGIKLSKNEKALVRKGDEIRKKAQEGEISESEAKKQFIEIYKKLTTIKD